MHYRLDGGLQSVIETPLQAEDGEGGWIDSCTLQNAAVVRAVLEAEPGLVLATFSGHDHAANPPYTHQEEGKPVYVTLNGMVEGAHADGHNAYSVVSIMSDCSVVVQGWKNQPNITVQGPANCNFEPGSSFV